MLQLQFLNISKPPVWLVEAKFIIGSSVAANCVLPLPGVLPEHVSLIVTDEAVDLIPYSKSAHTAVNGQLISGRIRLQHGDTITLGSAQIAVIDPKITRKVTLPELAEPVATWRLQATSSALAQREYPLIGTVILGRAKECDICLALAHLSRRHAKFTLTAKGLELEDLGSSNGTFVNGKKVQRVLLNDGDEVSFDSLRFKVVGPEDTSDKTSIRPVITEEFLKTEMISRPLAPGPHKPSAATVTPLRKPIEPPSTQPLSAPLIGGMFTLVAGFAFLIWFLLH